MKCRVCGSRLQPTTTSLPFKVTERTIVVLKQLPVAQCERCSEYSIEDAIVRMDRDDYGNCESCGKAIPISRLRAIPYATACIECRRKAESGPGISGGTTWNRVFDSAELDSV